MVPPSTTTVPATIKFTEFRVKLWGFGTVSVTPGCTITSPITEWSVVRVVSTIIMLDESHASPSPSSSRSSWPRFGVLGQLSKSSGIPSLSMSSSCPFSTVVDIPVSVSLVGAILDNVDDTKPATVPVSVSLVGAILDNVIKITRLFKVKASDSDGVTVVVVGSMVEVECADGPTGGITVDWDGVIGVVVGGTWVLVANATSAVKGRVKIIKKTNPRIRAGHRCIVAQSIKTTQLKEVVL